MNKPTKTQNVVMAIGALFFFVGVFIVWRTIFLMIPVVYMLAAVVTESEILINNSRTFVYIWSAGNLMFLLGVLILAVQRLILNRKGKKRV